MDNIQCYICNNKLDKPKMCVECQTPFCEECIAKKLSFSQCCPKCNVNLEGGNSRKMIPFRFDSSFIISNEVIVGNQCKEHNKEFTLYCELCDKDLCVSCLNVHLYHRVINKTTKEVYCDLNFDIDTLIRDIETEDQRLGERVLETIRIKYQEEIEKKAEEYKKEIISQFTDLTNKYSLFQNKILSDSFLLNSMSKFSKESQKLNSFEKFIDKQFLYKKTLNQRINFCNIKPIPSKFIYFTQLSSNPTISGYVLDKKINVQFIKDKNTNTFSIIVRDKSPNNELIATFLIKIKIKKGNYKNILPQYTIIFTSENKGILKISSAFSLPNCNEVYKIALTIEVPCYNAIKNIEKVTRNNFEVKRGRSADSIKRRADF